MTTKPKASKRSSTTTKTTKKAEKPLERSEQLIHRIAELEYEQRTSREQIGQLTTDKARIEAALEKLKSERQHMAAEMEAALQARLSKILAAKEREQEALRNKIANYQAETEKQMTRLRRERDEALAMTQHHNVHEKDTLSITTWLIGGFVGMAIIASVALYILST